MNRVDLIRNGLLSIAVVFAASALAQETDMMKKEKPQYKALGEYVNPEDSLPRLRYFEDGLVTLNDRCPVRKVRLNPKMAAAYVNGRPIGFC